VGVVGSSVKGERVERFVRLIEPREGGRERREIVVSYRGFRFCSKLNTLGTEVDYHFVDSAWY